MLITANRRWYRDVSDQHFLSNRPQPSVTVPVRVPAPVALPEMQEGRIVEQGTHDELLAARGAYHDLYHAQFSQALVDMR